MDKKLKDLISLLKEYKNNKSEKVLDNISDIITSFSDFNYLFYKESSGKRILDYFVEIPVLKTFLELLDEDVYLIKYDGKQLIEYLLDLDVNFSKRTSLFTETELMDVFLKRKKYLLLAFCDNYSLIEKKDLNNTYLDYLIEGLKKEGNIKIFDSEMIPDNDLLAKIILINAKHDLITPIKNLSAQRLMKVDVGDNRLIDMLLEDDLKVTMEKIVPDYLSDLKLFIYLKLKQLELDKYNVSFDKDRLALIFLDSTFKEKEKIQLDNESEELLNRFRTIMLSDNRSDKQLVEKVVISYKEAITIDKDSIEEIKNLIKIKERIPEFSIQKADNGKNCYSIKNKTVYFSNRADSGTVHHEIGHAMYHLLTDCKVPDEFEVLINKRMKEEDFVEQVYKQSLTSNECRKAFQQSASNCYQKRIKDAVKIRRDIWYRRVDSKEKVIKTFEDLGYEKSEIEAAFEDGVPSFEECKAQEEIIVINTLVAAVVSAYYPRINATSDIIDAVSLGEYFDKLIMYKGVNLPGFYGHGKKYYNKYESKEEKLQLSFDEIIANYSVLIKSEESKLAIETLRSIMGDEFVNFLEEYYNKEIRSSKKYENKETIKL